MIKYNGFFERSSNYRINPEEVVEFFNIKPSVDYTMKVVIEKTVRSTYSDKTLIHPDVQFLIKLCSLKTLDFPEGFICVTCCGYLRLLLKIFNGLESNNKKQEHFKTLGICGIINEYIELNEIDCNVYKKYEPDRLKDYIRVKQLSVKKIVDEYFKNDTLSFDIITIKCIGKTPEIKLHGHTIPAHDTGLSDFNFATKKHYTVNNTIGM